MNVLKRNWGRLFFIRISKTIEGVTIILSIMTLTLRNGSIRLEIKWGWR